MAFEITDYVKMTINKFGFDEDEILETIENYEDIVRKDNIVLYKKNFNFWEYCYLIYGCITNEINIMIKGKKPKDPSIERQFKKNVISRFMRSEHKHNPSTRSITIDYMYRVLLPNY